MATAPAESREAFEYPLPSPEISGGWTALLKVFGPGAIIASVTVGTGETIFAPRMGALFGYTMFWVVLTAVIAKALLVYGGMRHLVLAGEHPMQAWARFPGPRGWLPALIGAVAVISFPLWLAALSDAVGSICIWVTGLGAGQWWGRPFWGTTVIVVTMALTLVQTYDVLERVSFVFLALKILFVLAACLVVKPDWVAALFGLLPQLPAYPGWAHDRLSRAGQPSADPGGGDAAGHRRRRRAGLHRLRRLRAREALGGGLGSGGRARPDAARRGAGAPRPDLAARAGLRRRRRRSWPCSS